MKSLLHFYSNLTNRLNQVAVFIAELALIALMIYTCYAVVARYVFNSPSIYATEICIYLLLISIWFAVGYVHQVDRHVRVEIFENFANGKVKTFINIISALCVIAFCIVLVWAGFMVAETAFIKNYRSTSILRFPLWITYSLIPIGGLLLGMVAIDRLITQDKNLVAHKDEAE